MRIVPAFVGCAVSFSVLAAAAAQDPHGAELLARIAAHPVLHKLVFVERSDFEPIRFAFQRPDPRYTRGFEQQMADAHAPWLQRVEHNFRTGYVEGSDLVRRNDRPKPFVVLLWQATDYAAYRK